MTYDPDRARTLEFAQIAFSLIEKHGLAADPATYEVMYAYAQGHHQELNREINALLGAGAIGRSDVEKLYERHLSPSRLEQVLEETVQGVTAMMADLSAALSTVGQSNQDALARIEEARTMIARDPVRAGNVMGLVAKGVAGVVGALSAQCASANETIRMMDDQIKESRDRASRDALTEIFNRQYFDDALKREMSEHLSDRKPLSLLIGDIDHFKVFNDTYGHALGDQVLRVVAQALQQNVKGRDTAARYGGEEFVVILPNTAIDHAVIVAETIRHTIHGRELKRKTTGDMIGRITMSIGVAAMRKDDTPHTFLDRADKALYAAKSSGRNRVLSEIDMEDLEPIEVECNGPIRLAS